MDENMITSVSENDKDEEVAALPGFRFHPTDEELVGFYLRRKVEKKPLSIELIKQVDIYKYDPWDLPKVIRTVGEKEWYFFCMRGRKYRNSIRPNRVTKSGFWKATGIDKPIFSGEEEDTHECIGLKKTLVYYIGSAGKGMKTEWMMHEFRLPPTWENANQQNANSKNSITPEAEVWTLCRILKRNASFRKHTPYKKQDTNDGSSTSFSVESDNGDENINSRDLFIEQNREKLVIEHVEGRNANFPNQQNSTAQTPFTTSQLSFGNPNSDEFRDGNWDDLRTVFELANDPYVVHQFR